MRPSLVFAAVDIVSKVLALGVVIVLGRRLPGDFFGEVVSALALAGIASALLDMGVNFRLVALAVSDPSRARQTVSRRYQVLLATLLVVTPVAVIPSFRLAAFALVAAVFMSTLPVGALLAAGERRGAAFALIVPNILFLAPITLIPHLTPSSAIGYWALVNLGTLLALWTRIAWLRPSWPIQLPLVDVYRESFAIGLFNVIVLAYGRADTILVALLVSATAAGVYGTSYRVVLAVVSLASWSGGILAKRLYEESAGAEHLRRLVKALLLVGFVTAPVLYYALPWMIDVFLGSGAELSAMTLLALALVPLPTMTINALVYFLVVRGRQRELIAPSVIAAVAAAILYTLFIRLFGVAGAAWSSLAVETIACVLFARQVRDA